MSNGIIEPSVIHKIFQLGAIFILGRAQAFMVEEVFRLPTALFLARV